MSEIKFFHTSSLFKHKNYTGIDLTIFIDARHDKVLVRWYFSSNGAVGSDEHRAFVIEASFYR